MIKSMMVAFGLAACAGVVSAQRVGQSAFLERSATRLWTSENRDIMTDFRARALCDLKQVSRLRSRKTFGALVMIAGAGVSLLGVRPGQGSSFTYPLAGAALVGVGGYMRYYGSGYEQVWSSTLNAVQVGRTTRAEIVDCLGDPRSSSTASGGDVLTWIATKPGVFSGGSYRSASIAFRSNVVSDVRKTEAQQ